MTEKQPCITIYGCKETDLQECSLLSINSSASKLLVAQKFVIVNYYDFCSQLPRVWMDSLKSLARTWQRIEPEKNAGMGRKIYFKAKRYVFSLHELFQNSGL
jgi:hypothetical protein